LVAAVPLLPHPRPAVLVHHIVGRAVAVVVAGAVVGPGLLLDDVVPVPDDGRAAQLGDSQLAGVVGYLRVPDHGPLAAVQLDVHRSAAGVPEDHLRLVAADDRGVHRALLSLFRRQSRKPVGRRDRPGMADGRTAARYRGCMTAPTTTQRE